jgi:hypothetical protein
MSIISLSTFLVASRIRGLIFSWVSIFAFTFYLLNTLPLLLGVGLALSMQMSSGIPFSNRCWLFWWINIFIRECSSLSASGSLWMMICLSRRSFDSLTGSGGLFWMAPAAINLRLILWSFALVPSRENSVFPSMTVLPHMKSFPLDFTILAHMGPSLLGGIVVFGAGYVFCSLLRVLSVYVSGVLTLGLFLFFFLFLAAGWA